MIRNIFTFLLCCFATTLNLKTIESAGNSKICPTRFFVQITHKNLLRAVNNVKTLKKRPKIDITREDERNLTTSVCRSIDEYHLKLKSRDKLEKKGRDIICSFCVFAQSNVLWLKNFVEKITNGEPFINNENFVKRLKNEAEMIVVLFPVGDLQMGKWLWSYFLKIVAIRQYDDNKLYIHGNPFEDEQMQTGFSDFIENCIAENYLPPAAMDPDFVTKNESKYKKMFTDLSDSRWFKNLIASHPLDRNYNGLIDILYLKPFWEDGRQLLFRGGTIAQGFNVDWSRVRQRHRNEVVITREFVENRTWISNPYGRLDHQHLLIKIIDATYYCYISVIIYIYEKQLSILNEPTLEEIKELIIDVINEALYVSIKEEFLLVIFSELDCSQMRDIDVIKGILASVRAKANGILNDLNGANTNEIDWLSFTIDEGQLSNDSLIKIIISDFEFYLNELKRYFLPFKYEILLHFSDVVKFSAAQYI
ncbi:uncharacterized protein LOC126845994 [Adelges cooleyi]|uniref:uncharacterized protein LOC126845994 n=1 Tax=Adelges cooleyi TaxID=133065 RepID=UPI0021800C59|nr:uncharacterized protein LOC126845994 [Adelges cooleyi]